MGTNSSTSHQSYTVAPAAPGDTAAAGTAAGAADAIAPVPESMLLAIATIDGLSTVQPGDDPAAAYEQLTAMTHAAQSALADAAAAGASPEQLAALQAQVKQATATFLQQLTPEQLQQLAAAQGFEHPALVGLSGSSVHPLVHWLDPAYPAQILSKTKIQAAAANRYAALCAGETVGGLTLQDLHALEGGPPGPAAGVWAASPTEVLAAQSAALEAAAALQNAKFTDKGNSLAAVIAAENHLFTADCPELGDQLQIAQMAARHHIDQVLNKSFGGSAAAPVLRELAMEVTGLPAEQINTLWPVQAMALARLSTDAAERTALTDIAAARRANLETLLATVPKFQAVIASHTAPMTLPSLGTPEGQQALAEFADLAQQIYVAQKDCVGWMYAANLTAEETQVAAPWTNPSAGEATQKFRAWAKGQALADLRSAAQDAGLGNAGTASRTHVQNFLAAQWDPNLSATEIQHAVAAAAAAPKPAKASKPAGSTKTAQATPTTAAAAPKAAGGGGSAVVDPGPLKAAAATPGSWAAQHQALVASLKLAAASSQDVPKRLEDSAVKAFDFGTGAPASLGGTHPKSLHTGPDGGTWMFKTDNSGGARAHVEAAVSAVFSRAGVPSVPVYVAQVGGKAGSVQPLLKDATHFSTNPSSWTQADVDAVVRYHAAAWAIADHDGKKDNVLRTAGGGVVPIDHGQAGKFLGEDRLSLDYSPNAKTVPQIAYAAHLAGSLPKGVKLNPAAAHPVIKALENIPDSQWRAMLHDFAHQRAKVHGHQMPAVRNRAAKQHGVPAGKLTAHQVAETMLDMLCERKNTLRSSFAAFFTKDLKLPTAATVLKVGR